MDYFATYDANRLTSVYSVFVVPKVFLICFSFLLFFLILVSRDLLFGLSQYPNKYTRVSMVVVNTSTTISGATPGIFSVCVLLII